MRMTDLEEIIQHDLIIALEALNSARTNFERIASQVPDQDTFKTEAH